MKIDACRVAEKLQSNGGADATFGQLLRFVFTGCMLIVLRNIFELAVKTLLMRRRKLRVVSRLCFYISLKRNFGDEELKRIL